MSRWSASRLVMTASEGVRRRNVRSYSSASMTMMSPSPATAFDPNASTLPPTMIVGSKPPSRTTSPVIVVVVVLPCVPAMPTPYCIRMSSPSISARGSTGRRRCAAATHSGFSRGRTADENTTTSASPMFSAAWPS